MHTHKGVAPVVWVIIAALVLGGGYVLVSQKLKVESFKEEAKGEQTAERTQQKAAQSQTAVPSDLSRDEALRDWKTYRNEQYGFEFQYPSDWKQTSIFSSLGGYANAVAFVPSSREAQLQKALIPDSDIGAVVIQGSAVFVRPVADTDLVMNLERHRVLLNTSERVIDGKTVLYLLHSEKIDANKFGGGSTEIYAIKDLGFVIEANYASAEPTGELKNTFDQILSTLRFTK